MTPGFLESKRPVAGTGRSIKRRGSVLPPLATPADTACTRGDVTKGELPPMPFIQGLVGQIVVADCIDTRVFGHGFLVSLSDGLNIPGRPAKGLTGNLHRAPGLGPGYPPQTEQKKLNFPPAAVECLVGKVVVERGVEGGVLGHIVLQEGSVNRQPRTGPPEAGTSLRIKRRGQDTVYHTGPRRGACLARIRQIAMRCQYVLMP